MSTDSTFLHGKRVVVIGGSSGIGEAVATKAASLGADVVITGRSAAKLLEAKDRIGFPVETSAFDIANADAVRAAFRNDARIDHLFVLAGSVQFGELASTPVEVIRSPFETRVLGTYNVVRAALPGLDKKGSITLMSGTLSVRHQRGAGVVGAAIAAVEVLGRTWALELAPIRVNVLRPGSIETPLLAQVLGDRKAAVVAELSAKLPVGRIGTAQEVADAAIFLAGNGYATGSVLDLNGGALL